MWENVTSRAGCRRIQSVARKWLVWPGFSQWHQASSFLLEEFQCLLPIEGRCWSWGRCRMSSHIVPHAGWTSKERQAKWRKSWSWLRSRDRHREEPACSLGLSSWVKPIWMKPNSIRSLCTLSNHCFLPHWAKVSYSQVNPNCKKEIVCWISSSL